MKEMRPTTGKVMQALFNILGPLRGKSFLDLFSGTGQIALNAYKRDAAPVCLVESERKRFGDIVKTMPEDVKCHCMDVRRVLSKFERNGESFDIIFADPPYALEKLPEIPDLVLNGDLLNEEGIFVFEHGKNYDFSDHPRFLEHRSYGSVNFSIFR